MTTNFEPQPPSLRESSISAPGAEGADPRTQETLDTESGVGNFENQEKADIFDLPKELQEPLGPEDLNYPRDQLSVPMQVAGSALVACGVASGIAISALGEPAIGLVLIAVSGQMGHALYKRLRT